MADDVNAKNVEKNEQNLGEQQVGGGKAETEQRFRDEIFSQPAGGGKADSLSQMEGRADKASSLPSVNFGDAAGGGKGGGGYKQDKLGGGKGGGGYKHDEHGGGGTKTGDNHGSGEKNQDRHHSMKEDLGTLLKQGEPKDSLTSGNKSAEGLKDNLQNSKNNDDFKDKLNDILINNPNGAELGGKLGDKLGDNKHESFEHLNKEMSEMAEQEEGVEQLPTGDHIVREDGKESLFTPNGDRITLNPDGSHTIKGDVRKVTTDKEGVTTVTFGDGASVSFDQDGFLSVNRGNQGVAFGRGGGGGGGGGGGEKPMPWGDKPSSPPQWGDPGKPFFPKEQSPNFPNNPKPTIGPEWQMNDRQKRS